MCGGDEYDLALDGDVRVAGVIAEDHGAFALGGVERAYIKVAGNLDFGRSENGRDVAELFAREDVTAFDADDFTGLKLCDGKQTASVDRAGADFRFG